MSRISVVYQLVRYFGIRWLVFRLFYALKLRTGWLERRFPPYSWSDRPLGYWLRPEIPASPEQYAAWRKNSGVRFFFDESLFREYAFDATDAIAEADAILAGTWTYFTRIRFDVGMPPNWHSNPLTGQTIPADRHWSKISDFDSGDIKFVWEASRFAVVFTLVRAFAATRSEKYPLAFWHLVEDWAVRNPPQLGPNWKCGQEATFRVMAWCFGLWAFHEYATPEQISRLVSMIAAHGDRIAGNIDYARSQNNNHGVSEAVGLWTIGTLFPELSAAERWVKAGKQIAEAEIRRQVYDDGTYTQHSPNYQRVMLHDALWVLRLGELNNAPFPPDIYEKVARSANFLLQILDLVSGHVPNHGANDGALVLPLSHTEPEDFRPVIQAAHYLVKRERLFDGFDEDILWLFGKDALESPKSNESPKQKCFSAQTGGYYTLRGDDSWLMVRCAEYRARPHHADQLHVDLWWKGINLAHDVGTYLYNGTPPWDNGLAGTLVHNTVAVDLLDQMTRAGRFLWLNWSRGRVLRQISSHHLEYFEGEHDGYASLGITYRRGILRLGDQTWLILDRLVGKTQHKYRLHWLLQDFPYQVRLGSMKLQTPQGEYNIQMGSSSLGTEELIRADETTTRGWVSRYYGKKVPALSWSLTTDAATCLFWTLFSPLTCTVKLNTDRLLVTGQDWRLEISPFKSVRAIKITGSIEDQLS